MSPSRLSAPGEAPARPPRYTRRAAAAGKEAGAVALERRAWWDKQPVLCLTGDVTAVAAEPSRTFRSASVPGSPPGTSGRFSVE